MTTWTDEQHYAFIYKMMKALKEKKSWCGETHLQKAAYFAQEMLDVPLDYDFVLYRYGPFSFELKDRFAFMRSRFLLEDDYHTAGYAPSVKETEHTERLLEKHLDIGEDVDNKISNIATWFGESGVGELEKISTAWLLYKRDTNRNRDYIAQELHEKKPHISVEEAKEALNNVLSKHKEF